MLHLVSVKRKSFLDYVDLMSPDLAEEVHALALRLRGARLLHLNSTWYGGGVAELLLSLVALEKDLGLDVEWRNIGGDEGFFTITKGLHNGLQGKPYDLTADAQAIYLAANRSAAAQIGDGYDAVLVHDPQPAAVAHFARSGATRWIWRCHIDTSVPDPGVWGFLKLYIDEYDAAVFTMPQFVPPGLSVRRVVFIPPAIDPLAAKNRPLPDDLVAETVSEFGVDGGRPLLLQVSRFDPWKDLNGTIGAYHLVKQTIPGLQLALVGSMAGDDPEAWEIYRRIVEDDHADDDLFVFTNLVGVGSLEVNCFQRAADVVIQKSIREGFGLAVTEALWKQTPVVAGATGGIPLQMHDRVGGFLVTTTEQCADRILYLLQHPAEAATIAAAGMEHVRAQFLMPRLLRDELRLLADVLERAPAPPGERGKDTA
ncbi:MAG TPA: glycosyltransferase [bacterium]|jgi:trehalose synthase